MDVKKLDWSLLRSFLAVIDSGSLLGAAKRLGTYQPTISRQIAELESQLNVPLFERTGRGLIPTVAALRIIDPARQMAAAVDEVGAKLRLASMQSAGSVRVSASEVVGTYLLPQCISRMRKENPAIQFEIVVTNQVSNLLRREADIALRMVRPVQSSLVAKKIADIPLGAFATKEYLSKRKKITKLADLLGHDLIGMDTDNSLLQTLAGNGLQIEREGFCIRTDNQITYAKMVEYGAGIGFLPRYVASQMNNIIEILPGRYTVTLPLWLVVHREIKGNTLIRNVYDQLSKILNEEISVNPIS